jgi:hypothetical protein
MGKAGRLRFEENFTEEKFNIRYKQALKDFI